MHTFTLLTILSLSSFALASHDVDSRRLHRALMERQGQGRPDQSSISDTASPTAQSSVSATSSAGSSTAVSITVSSTASSVRASDSSTVPSPTATSSVVPSPSATSSAAESSDVSQSSSAQPTSSSAVPISQPSPTGGVSTISVPSSSSAVAVSTLSPTSSSASRSSSTSILSISRTTSSASGSASAASASADTTSSGGLSKPALIAIIVTASVIGIAAIAFTLFRKWKLRPSNRFDEKRLNAINFAPQAGGHGDDFFEKAHNRSASASSAERHRKALMAEEFDSAPGLTAGIPDHDFTARPSTNYGMAGAGAGAAGMYNSDPFAHTQQYDYASYGEAEHGYPPQTYDQYGHPVVNQSYDQPTQDQEYINDGGAGQGYTDLQRGNSDGSAHQHGHASQRVMSPTNAHSPVQAYDDMTFPESGNYLGRPTGGADGPYAQAAQYRAY